MDHDRYLISVNNQELSWRVGACGSLAMVGRATLAIAPSSTAIEIPMIIVAIAPYRWGKRQANGRFFPWDE